MNAMVLAVVAVVCGAAAIWMWMQQGRSAEAHKKLAERVAQAEAEARKEAERAEGMRKRLDAVRETAPKDDRPLREARAQAATAKEEVRRLQAHLKRHEQDTAELQVRLRRTETRADELAQALAERQGKKPAVIETPPVAVVAAPVVRAADPAIEVRKAELEAERAARIAEAEKAKADREAARAARQDNQQQAFIDQLKAERERLRQLVFERELQVRILVRKSEHNRRAYLMTMGALDLAEDELYRIKHGRERPEYGRLEGGETPEFDHGRTLAEAPDGATAADEAAARAAADHATEGFAEAVAAAQEAVVSAIDEGAAEPAAATPVPPAPEAPSEA